MSSIGREARTAGLAGLRFVDMAQKTLDIEILAGPAGAIALERGREVHEAQQIRDIPMKAAERTAEAT